MMVFARSCTLPLALIALSMGVLVSCDTVRPTGPNPIQRYPTVYPRLSADSLASLNDSLAQINSRTCSGLDEYGLTSFGWCAHAADPNVGEDVTTDSLLQIVKTDIVRIARFTGITDTAALQFGILFKFRNSGDLILFAIAHFDNQIYHGLEVQSTALTIIVDTLGIIDVSGHHYPYVYVPEPSITPDEARGSLLGQEITWEAFDGSSQIYTVADESFCLPADVRGVQPDPPRGIVPLESDEGMEMRVAWKIGVGCVDPFYGFPAWELYVDVVTGEHLLTVQLFYT